MLVATMGVNNRIAESKPFAKHVIEAMGKFSSNDWGDLCDEDRQMNDEAVITKNRVLASYGTGNDKIWIIKDAGESAPVTILFPDEY